MWAAGTLLHRGRRTEHDAATFVPGLGATRFAPVPDTAHVYVATSAIGALLESALHDAAPPFPRIQAPTIAGWSSATVELRHDLRLIDLRDPELARLAIDRSQLVSTPAVHYACTRAWAAPLHGRVIGGQQTHGLIWDSRQAELHARAAAARPALATLITEHPTAVAVIWSPPASGDLLGAADSASLGSLASGDGAAFIHDLMALLRIVSDPG